MVGSLQWFLSECWPLLRSGQLSGFEFLARPLPWVLFNFVFISFYQMLLLLLIASPAIVANAAAVDGCAAPLNALDVTAFCLVFVCVLMESIADDQQFYFQIEKYRKYAAKEVLVGEYKVSRGGLFSQISFSSPCSPLYLFAPTLCTGRIQAIGTIRFCEETQLLLRTGSLGLFLPFRGGCNKQLV